jgi:hypothetical protein
LRIAGAEQLSTGAGQQALKVKRWFAHGLVHGFFFLENFGVS